MKHKLSHIRISRLLIPVCFLALLLNPTVSVAGAKAGLILWFQTILPILLPFMIISNLMITLDTLTYLTFFLEPFAKLILHLSKKGSYVLLTGLLCGYPMGSKTTADLLKHDKISLAEAQYLLHFCNNASPAFVVSFLCSTIFQNNHLVPFFLISLYLAPILCGLIFYPIYRKSLTTSYCISQKSELPASKPPSFSFALLDKAIMDGFESITKLGGYIILFSILSAWFHSFTMLSEPLKCILLGITELTTGIHYLGASSLPLSLRILSVCACASFGGLSGIAQTQSMIQNTGISIFYYITGKLITSILAVFIMSLLLIYFGNLL